MPNIADVCDHVRQWLAGGISLREFEDWFVPETWNVHSSGDSELESLVDEIELNLSEYSDHVLNADELRREMANAIRPFDQNTASAEKMLHIVYGVPPSDTSTSAKPLVRVTTA